MKVRAAHKQERTVAVIYGGKSCEHDVSIITACLAKGYFKGKLVSVYIDKQNRAFLAGNEWTPRDHLVKTPSVRVVFLTGEGALGIVRGKRLSKLHVDVAVNCCHGLNGEDGCVAALCQLAGIPLVGSDVASSAVAMNKSLCKQVLAQCGFPVVKGVELKTPAEGAKAVGLGFPLIVKPSLLGSSIGVNVAHCKEELTNALDVAFRYCGSVLAEVALTDFSEFNCAAMRVDGKVQTSNVESPVTLNELLTFEDKYIENNAEKKSPATLTEELKGEVKRLTAEIYEKLGFAGVIRVDYLFDNATGKLYVNEINTTPGSLAFGLWQGQYSRTRYGEALVDEAIADYRQLQGYLYTFDSGVLDGAGGVKKK